MTESAELETAKSLIQLLEFDELLALQMEINQLLIPKKCILNNMDSLEFEIHAKETILFVSCKLGFNVLMKNRTNKYKYARYVLVNIMLNEYSKIRVKNGYKGYSVIGRLFGQDHATIINSQQVHNNEIYLRTINAGSSEYLETQIKVESAVMEFNRNKS